MTQAPIDIFIFWLEMFGVAVFAVSGALEASRRQMDIVGFMLIATVTAVGGGTVRDMLLGIAPVWWITVPHVLAVCFVCAVAVFFIAPWVESRFRLLLWADALGLSVACTIGTEKALAAGVGGGVAIVMGVITATFGGVVRDILCNQVPLILRREIYATAAAAGAVTYVALHAAGLGQTTVAICAFLGAFVIRALALVYGFSLPGYRSRPGREM